MTESETKTRDLLKRRELATHVANFDQELLINRAAEYLGYTHIKTTQLSLPAVQALREAGIRPFDRTTVEAYKKERKAQANLRGFGICLCTIILLVLIPGIMALAAWSFFPLLLWGASLIGCMFTIAFFGQPYNWRLVDLRAYDQTIPSYVLQTALDVREALNKAGIKHQFMVDVLTTAKPDPFLVLTIDGHHEYLEVWDEPTFGIERTV